MSGLGGDVHLDAIHRRVMAVPGVAACGSTAFGGWCPEPPTTSPPACAHRPEEVAILRHPYGEGFPDGLLTVQICVVVP